MKQRHVWAIVASVCISVSGWAQQQSGAPASSSAALSKAPAASAAVPQDIQNALKDRAAAYYTAIVSGNRAAAEEMILPESRPDFEQADFRTLGSFRIDQISLDASGEKADVAVTRSFRGAFGMDIPWHDQWVKTDGQWMLAFPKNTHETPFGAVKPNTAPVDPQVMQRMAERQMRSVDPDQPMIQLQKYLKEHPEAMPTTTVMVPDPRVSIQQQTSQPQTSPAQGDAKASSAAKPAAADANTGKSKKKGSKKSKPPSGTTAPQS